MQGCTINNPIISQNGSILQSTPGTSYQWFLNGNPIAGATFQNYTPTQSGNYNVEVTYYNNCAYPSNTIVITITSIDNNPTINYMNVYPNPANNIISINYVPTQNEINILSITNILGQTLIQKPINCISNSMITENIDLSDLSPGIYYLVINGKGLKFSEKIVKQ